VNEARLSIFRANNSIFTPLNPTFFKQPGQRRVSIDMAMPLECPSQIVPNEGHVSVNPGIRAMSRQQWEELKPLIEQTYIQENKPFPYLAEVLRRDHGFEPT
jgi:hypothetical protein